MVPVGLEQAYLNDQGLGGENNDLAVGRDRKRKKIQGQCRYGSDPRLGYEGSKKLILKDLVRRG